MHYSRVTTMELVLLAFLAPVFAGAQGAPTTTRQQRSVALNSYNTWHITSEADHLDPVKLQAGVDVLSQFDSVVLGDSDSLNHETPGWTGASPAAIKQLNPAAKIYLYYRLVKYDWETDWLLPASSLPAYMNLGCPVLWYDINANNWWLRDGKGVPMQMEGGYLLDIGKPGFKEQYLKAMLGRMGGQPVSGVILDYLLPGLSIPALASHPRPAAYSTDTYWYNNAYVPFVNYVFDGMHKAGYKMVGGSTDYSARTQAKVAFIRSKMDVNIYEAWLLNWDGSWRSQAEIAQRILDFNQDPLESWAADFGLRAGVPDFERKHTAALAMYYVSLPSTPTPLRSFHYYNDTPYWHPLWNLNIGTPVGSVFKWYNKYFWMRTFTGGMVYLNYEDSMSFTANLARTSVDVNGKTYSGRITIPPKTALILAYK